MSKWLELLEECGVDISHADWVKVHPGPTEEVVEETAAPTPRSFLGEVPCFGSDQVAYCPPERWGIDVYHVVEDPETAHPFVLSWSDEQYYRANYRPKHRYSRVYRLRWTLAHVLGRYARADPPVMDALREALGSSGVLHTRAAYEWVRSQLRILGATHLYMSIPGIVSLLGGPGWACSDATWAKVEADAIALHRAFELDKGGRQRFPKMQYVLLRLLHAHGVAPPYRVLWARTSIKRKQLAAFLDGLPVRTPIHD